MARDATKESKENRAFERAGRALDAILTRTYEQGRVLEVKIQAEGGTRAFLILKGVWEGEPVASFRQCADLIEELGKVHQALGINALEWREDRYPSSAQLLLSGMDS